MKARFIGIAGVVPGLMLLAAPTAAASDLPGEGPRLNVDITQEQIAGGQVSLLEIRAAGLRVFSTPFNKADGYGDGPMLPSDPTTPGGRPTLQGNGTFLRVNGLDGQACLECHSVVSSLSIPAKLGIGGVGGSVTNAMFLPTLIDVADDAGVQIASFNGRFINPPFLFGSGGIELLAKEMTAELQVLKVQAQANPGTDVALVTKGVDFGVLRYENGAFDTSRVNGVDADLVVRPFGRKGEFATVRSFDEAAMMFHFGMQPVEAVGVDDDADADGVANELLVGEMSALVIFNTTLEKPRQQHGPGVAAGFALFQSIGCSDCHIPALQTTGCYLTYSFPEVATDPWANVFYQVDLTDAPTRFKRAPAGGVSVPLFADLKRHDMGPDLAESFGSLQDPFFTTARLWGVADTAPYLHDGRATTLGEAILLHGGDAQPQREAYAALPDNAKANVLLFLRSLRTPNNPAADLLVRPQTLDSRLSP